MSSDQNTYQNPISTENSIPPSLQEPTEQAPEITPISTTPEVPPEVLESSPNDFPPKSIDIAPSNSSLTEPPDEPKPEENSAPNESVSEPSEAPEPETAQTPVNEPFRNPVAALLVTARNAIQFRKRKKLDRIMTLFEKRTSITNDEVEKFLHVSDATATRYLSILEKEGKIQQIGRTGKGVSYSRM